MKGVGNTTAHTALQYLHLHQITTVHNRKNDRHVQRCQWILAIN
jgi:hypothetical protein